MWVLAIHPPPTLTNFATERAKLVARQNNKNIDFAPKYICSPDFKE